MLIQRKKMKNRKKIIGFTADVMGKLAYVLYFYSPQLSMLIGTFPLIKIYVTFD